MTYSIVARDPDSGAFGVAVQTCWFAVGRHRPLGHRRRGGGGHPGHGRGGLRTQVSGEAGGRGRRPNGPRRGAGRRTTARPSARWPSSTPPAAWAPTPERCVSTTPATTRATQYSVQANMMASAEVWPAMAEAYETGTGTFPERLLAVLRAAEDAGGDARGPHVGGHARGRRGTPRPPLGRGAGRRPGRPRRPTRSIRSSVSCRRPTPSITATGPRMALFGGDPAAALRAGRPGPDPVARRRERPLHAGRRPPGGRSTGGRRARAAGAHRPPGVVGRGRAQLRHHRPAASARRAWLSPTSPEGERGGISGETTSKARH